MVQKLLKNNIVVGIITSCILALIYFGINTGILIYKMNRNINTNQKANTEQYVNIKSSIVSLNHSVNENTCSIYNLDCKIDSNFTEHRNIMRTINNLKYVIIKNNNEMKADLQLFQMVSLK